LLQDVAGDTELQAWASDVAHECLAWQDGNTRGMPDKILTVDNLVREVKHLEICNKTTCVFCCINTSKSAYG